MRRRDNFLADVRVACPCSNDDDFEDSSDMEATRHALDQ